MEIISLAGTGIDAAARRAAAVLREGGIVLYPSDTLYGLGADALSDEAVAKVAAIKGRDPDKPVHALVADVGMAARLGEVSESVRCMAEYLPQGKVTFIVKRRSEFRTGIFRSRDTFGFRVPDHAFCFALLHRVGGPVTATSANVAGMEPERTVAGILAQLGEAAEGIALAIEDGGAAGSRAASTVLDLSHGELQILRKGTVSATNVHSAWRACGE